MTHATFRVHVASAGQVRGPRTLPVTILGDGG